MIPLVHLDENDGLPARYTLTETEHGRVWGVSVEAEGLFGVPSRRMYELFGWRPEAREVLGWVGRRVWLVPEDEAVDPWLLEDAEGLAPLHGTDSLVLAGLDDYEGPPEGFTGPVRVHDGQRWLGTCREFARVLPAERAVQPLVLRGLSQSDELRAALFKGTRRALDLGEAVLEIRDDQGELLTEKLLWPVVSAWHPSTQGTDLIDLELDWRGLELISDYARPIWERWFAGPPDTPGAWAGLDTRRRGAWLDLVHERGCGLDHRKGPAGHAYELDGRNVTDVPGLYLALGEAMNGAGGYFGANLDAVDDCLGGGFGYTRPGTLVWQDAVTAREHLSQLLTPQGQQFDLFAELLEVLAEGRMNVVLA